MDSVSDGRAAHRSRSFPRAGRAQSSLARHGHRSRRGASGDRDPQCPASRKLQRHAYPGGVGRGGRAEKPGTDEQRRVLQVGAGEAVKYRRVRLACGGHVLSEADNWYVPARLTPEMNRQLDSSDIAFGRAVQALHFQRRTLSAQLLWSPLPDGWDIAGGALPDASARTLAIPHAVLEHRAMLVLPDGTPFSAVTETYTEQVLAFPQPRPIR